MTTKNSFGSDGRKSDIWIQREIVCMNDSPLARGEKVRVIKGPLSGLVGELVTVGSKSKIAVRLNMLGCACVDMPIGYVEPIHLINDTPKV